MANHDDDLEALRRIGPLDPANLVPPHDTKANALFERITMSDTAPAPSAPKRMGWIAAAVTVTALAVGGIIFAQGDDSKPDVAQPPAPSGAITPGGPATGSCVELYAQQTLANRETAFDGTVVRVNGDQVTLIVNEWYRGGDEPEVTLAGASVLAGLTSAGDGLSLAPGTRLLVAGDGGFAWSCGFTQPYDPAVAAEWAAALDG